VTSKDPTQPQIPIIQHADIKRMLLFQRAVVDRFQWITTREFIDGIAWGK
jgi:hypothetical protein